MKKLLLLSLISPILCFAQEVVSSSGDYFSNSNGSISFTVGEVAIETITTGSNAITQGFHQTNLGVLSVGDIEDDLAIKVFPNPVSELLQVTLTNYTDKSYRLFDITGRLVTQKTFKKQQSEINLSPYVSGIYILALYDENNKRINTYRIIKN